MLSTIAMLALLSASPVQTSLNTTPPSQQVLSQDTAELAGSYATELRLGAGDTLRNARQLSLSSGYVIHVQRYHQGVPVLNESAALQFDHAHNLVGVRTDFRPLEILQSVTVSAVSARIAGIKAVWGIDLPEAMFLADAYDDSLAIDGVTAQWVYAVHVPGVLPNQNRTVLVNATTGAIDRIINPTRHAANSANVFNPHPDPSGDLSDVMAVELENLTSDTQLRGQWVNAHNCLTDADSRRVFTCDTLLPIFAGGMGLPPGLTCSDPLIANFMGDLKHMVITTCGPAHKATPDGDNGYSGYAPVEATGSATYPHEAFEDEFAEINLYYHVDQATHFFHALGHFQTPTPLDGAVNLGMPSGDLISCAQAYMTGQNPPATDPETGEAAVAECMEQLAEEGKPAFSSIPNAFFSPAGPITSLLGFDNGGIFFFQGPTADFGYDGDVIYHEFGHNIVSQVGNNILTGGNLRDSYGLDDSPGALNEAYADYFAGAITGDAIVGGYVGKKLGTGEGIRRMDHDLACPDYWAGEVHADAWGWAGALWAARAVYPQTEVDSATGTTIRLFDRAVFEGLKTLTTNSTHADAAAATIWAVKQEAGLEDPAAGKLVDILTQRNMIDCKRIRELTTDTPIKELFVVAGPSGQQSPQDALMGGQSFTPYAPPHLQFKVEIANLGSDTQCATFQARSAEAVASSEGLDVPDLLGGDEQAPQEHKLQLLYNTEGPVEFSYSGSNVSSDQDTNVIEITTTVDATTFVAPLYFEKGVSTVHYALINAGPTSPRLGDIKLVNLNQDCVNPNAPEEPEPTPSVTPAADTGGCDCQSTSSSANLLLLALGALFFIRRKRTV